MAVYDVSQRSTFDELIKWFREIETYCAEDVVKIIVGNKVDKVRLTLRRTVADSKPSRSSRGRSLQRRARRSPTVWERCLSVRN